MSKPHKRDSWRPASTLDVRNKKTGYRYRFCNEEPENVERKEAEGWQFVNRVTGLPGELVDDEHKSDGAKRHRELVLMALPEDVGKERDKYFEGISHRQERGIYEQTKKDLGPARRTDDTDKFVIE
jgi:hypothetical protein